MGNISLARSRIISDNGPQSITKDFKGFIFICAMPHVRTSSHYPQSNGKIERRHGSLKHECIWPGAPLSIEDARRLAARFVEHNKTARLHRPKDNPSRLIGRWMGVAVQTNATPELDLIGRKTCHALKNAF